MIAANFNEWMQSLRSIDLSYLIDPPYSYFWVAAIGLLVIYFLFRIRPPSKIRAFRGDTGYVMVSRHALLELVYSACEQLPEVRKPSVRIRSKRKLHLQVRIQVDGSARLRDTSSFLQTHLKDALENNLGMERLGTIEVVVTGIRTTPKNRPDLNERRDIAPPTPPPEKIEIEPSSLSETVKPDLNAPLENEKEKSAESPDQASGKTVTAKRFYGDSSSKK